MTEKLSVREWISEVNGSKSEASIQDQIWKYLAGQRIYCTRQNSGRIHKEHRGRISRKTGQPLKDYHSVIKLHEPGTPDLLVIYRGFAIEIETKAKGLKPTPIQQAAQDLLKKAGAEIINADSFESFEAAWLSVKQKLDYVHKLLTSLERKS
jgi:hypothetical protein